MRFSSANSTLTLLAAGAALWAQTSLPTAPAPLIAYQGRLEEAGLPVTGARNGAQAAAAPNGTRRTFRLRNWCLAWLPMAATRVARAE